MDPTCRPRQVFQQRLNNALPHQLAEFARTPPTCFFDFSDDNDVSDVRARRLYDQLDRRQIATGTSGILTSYFLLGRIFFKLGRRTSNRLLCRWTTEARARHVYRAATRVFEVFDLSGPEFIFVSSLTPTSLRELSVATFRSFLCALQGQILLSRLTEQTPLEGNSVTVHGDANDLHP